MTRYFGGAAVAFALVSGIGTTAAQTVTTREITTEPVETIIERGPSGTVITRRPLEAAVPGSPLRRRSDTFVTPPVETVVAPIEETTGVSPTRIEPPATAAAPRPVRRSVAAAPVQRKARSSANHASRALAPRAAVPPPRTQA